MKTDSSGNMLWDTTYEGSGDEEPRYFIKTADGGYAIAGYTTSYGAGGKDGWLIKTDGEGNAQWNMTWGGPYHDALNGVAQTSDGGFVLTGEANYNGDFSSFDTMLVKTDSNGKVEWSRIYGGSTADLMRKLVLTSDGGVAMIGETSSFGAGGRDIWLLRTSLETGLEQVDAAANTLTFYREQSDPYWNYIRVQIWLRKTP
jgi:predicted secreted protein